MGAVNDVPVAVPQTEASASTNVAETAPPCADESEQIHLDIEADADVSDNALADATIPMELADDEDVGPAGELADQAAQETADADAPVDGSDVYATSEII